MIYIDMDSDLNMEGDDGRNLTVVKAGAPRPTVGTVLVGGRSRFWSWVVIDSVDENVDGSAVVSFHQVSAKHAARTGPLVAKLPSTI